ncbi:MAG: methylase [Parcubacteria group bacterium Gr01-1014_3]|nr:MAG: methylase [Parcubacteria group bacterium Gr01-1014_3]
MRYMSKKEIQENNEEVRDRLGKFVGPAVRHKYAIGVFKKYVSINNGPKVLDCGVASGGFAEDLRMAGFEDLYGLDIGDYLPAEKRPLLKEFKLADLSFDKIPWSDNFFDAITAWCVVPHLENPHNFFREAARTLKPGGLLIISLINIASPPNRKYFFKHGEFPGFHERNNHITFFTEAVFSKTALKYFDRIGIEYFTTPRIFNGFRGLIRKLISGLASLRPSWKRALENRWGPKIIYILKKK